MSDKVDDGSMCTVCLEFIGKGESSIRISAELSISNGDRGFVTGAGREILVFAQFHSRCVVETAMDVECDDIPHIWEARDLMSEMTLCEDCHPKMSGQQGPKLTLLRGGTS